MFSQHFQVVSLKLSHVFLKLDRDKKRDIIGWFRLLKCKFYLLVPSLFYGSCSLFRILTAGNLEREQRLEEAGGGGVREEHSPANFLILKERPLVFTVEFIR